MNPNPADRVDTEPSDALTAEDSGSVGLGPVRVIEKIVGWDEQAIVEVK